MGAKESQMTNPLQIIQTLDLGNISSIGHFAELAHLAKGHETELLAFLMKMSDLFKTKKGAAVIESITHSAAWPSIKKLLPSIIQWATMNKIDAASLSKMDPELLLKRVVQFAGNMNEKEATTQLADTFKTQLITPDDMDLQ
jgi:hypothetical protein